MKMIYMLLHIDIPVSLYSGQRAGSCKSYYMQLFTHIIIKCSRRYAWDFNVAHFIDKKLPFDIKAHPDSKLHAWLLFR